MTISEKIFLYFILFSIGAEYVRSTRPYRQQFEPFNPMSGSSPNFIPSGQGQGHVQVQALSGSSPSTQPMWSQWAPKTSTPPPVQPMWSQWAPKTSTPPPAAQPMWSQWTPKSTSPQPPPSTTTPSQQNRFLPTVPKTTHSSIHRARRKFGVQQVEVTETVVADKSRELIAQRDKAIAHITAKLLPYFMRGVVHDFGSRLYNITKIENVLLGPNEMAAVDNHCETCTVAELQGVLNILLTIMEKYPALIADSSLASHVATEYERAADYLNRKLEQLREEIAETRYDSDFRAIQRRYARRERNGGIISLLLEWYETFIHNGRDDERDIQQKLVKHLTTQKRYWLISIKGVL